MANTVKYLKGNLCSEGLIQYPHAWASNWYSNATKAKDEGKNLIVIEVPEKLDWLKVGSAIEDMIEGFIAENPTQC